MIDQKAYEQFSPLAYEWAKHQEDLILERGAPLPARALEDAVRVGVQEPSRVRVLVVDRIPLPDDKEFAEAARRADILTESSRGVTIGYGIILRADCWGNRELLVHQLVHVAQCERSGGLETFVQEYLGDRHACANFTKGSLEDEAWRVAREICATG